MEYFSNTQPNSFATAHQTSLTLKTKLYLMSKSTQVLRDIQNLQLYLSKKFRPARWLDSIFEQPASTLDFNSFGRLGELDLLANYVRLIDQNYSRQLGVMWTLVEFHQYCQFQPFVKSLKSSEGTPSDELVHNPARRKGILPASWYIYQLFGRESFRRAGKETSSPGGTPPNELV
ncbi:uncharacterized protein PGTG_07690 [Puccinia graminis f. sp. tritici CRL 75-36-700-3]|uniref:Uncharacterized protein n=1 Tax=Puccinia graminis f. sp. tritici (strain CRL 75-36-700-3 / race SCCL) TaxID=418459 RepID=E3KD55_PUCGT|nr:uncharacterized protein PGTG_07690 [Puccinia graminis f. sp. tritici CRL 75-36-700-3]EFP82293.1 hypothetical protein PGTG_07690 [Puccinia graminis f. sp. tritici CRL 75-36-700-3]